MSAEVLSEGWVKFTRYHCKKGYVDVWRGDSSNDPNNEKESNLSLNLFTSYYRFYTGNGWIHHSYFHNGIMDAILHKRDELTSDDICEAFLFMY